MPIKESVKSFWQENRVPIFKPTVTLLCICLLVTLALSLANRVTAPKIAALTKQQEDEAMALLLKADTYETAECDGKNGKVSYHIAKNGEEVIGYLFSVKSKGYGGDVSVLVAVNPDKTVHGVDILDVSSETPGLGQNASRESFYSQYTGKKSGVTVLKNGADPDKNEVDAVTGATITSRAVTAAVNEALALVEDLPSVSAVDLNATQIDAVSAGGEPS